MSAKQQTLVPLDVIANEIEQRGWTMSAAQTTAFTKGLLLGLALGRANQGTMADEEKLRQHVRMLFEQKVRRRRRKEPTQD